jgi:uncharacterized membrane protein YfcA
VPISKVVTLGTAVANILVDMQLRHPQADRPLIDFATCAVLLPCQLIGTIVGVMLNAIIPEWALSLTLLLFLIWMSVTTTRKAFSLYQAEKESLNTPAEQQNSLLDSRTKGFDPQVQAMVEHEEAAPLLLLFALLVVWAVVISSALIKGGVTIASEAQCGSLTWWLMTLMPIPPCLIFLLYMMHYSMRITKTKLDIGYPFLPSDMKWESWPSLRWPVMCTLAGISSGALGLGGGTITSPLMLSMGLHPKVVAANAAFMILFTASSTSTQYLVSGRLTVEYAAWYCAFGLVSCLFGHILVHFLMRGRSTTWHLVAIVAFVIIASAVGIAVMGSLRLDAALSSNASLGIRDLCYYSP